MARVARAAIVGARITARGPVTVETMSGPDGQYGFAALPDGNYEVTVTMPDGRHGLLVPKPATATLAGAHALWSGDFRAEVDGVVTGVVVDINGRAVGGAPIFLDAQPRSSDPADLASWNGKTNGEGRYEFRGVPPSYYLVTIDKPFVPTYARTVGGAEELPVGFADRLELAPLVAMRGATVAVEGVVVDPSGRPVKSIVHLGILGPRGPYPRSGSFEESDTAGRFKVRLLRGRRYRVTTIADDESRGATTELVADGSPIRIVLP